MLDLLFPPSCAVCGERGRALCDRCWRRLRPAPPSPPPADVALCRSLLLYDGAARDLIARLKYRNARSVIGWLTDGMARLIGPHAAPGTVVTWAPTSPARRRERGFDQAELLAKRVARILGAAAVPLLRRRTDEHQTGRSATDRRAGVAFCAIGANSPANVLVVDDVVTTGATLAAAAAALRNGTSTTVIAVTAASTPLKVPDIGSDA